VPVTHRVILKPNFTSVRNGGPMKRTGAPVRTRSFTKGIILGLKELGLKRFHFLEANNFHSWNYGVWRTSTIDMAWR